ncbi:MAG: porin family protein [Rhodobacteraceae bacterium]|nr:porin family protein [Paracoccaceae bacterium]
MRYSAQLSILSMIIAAPAFAGGPVEVIVEPAPAPVMVVVAPVTGWSGGYLGASVNWGNASVDATGDAADALNDFGIGSTLSKPSGVSGAIRAGYDWQRGQGVFGIGGEYNFANYEAGLESGLVDAAAEGDLDLTGVNVSVENMATIFGRAGYAVNDQFLAYGLVGYSWADGKVSMDGESESRNLDGLTLGVGGEYKFNQNWSAFGEYDYTNFGTIEDTSNLLENSSLEADINVFKLGVNYRF